MTFIDLYPWRSTTVNYTPYFLVRGHFNLSTGPLVTTILL